LMIFPGFILANPTNLTIEPATYQVQLALVNGGPTIGIHDPDSKFTVQWGGATLNGLLGQVKFNLHCPQLLPGESAAFTLRDVDGTGEVELLDHSPSVPRIFDMDNEWL